MFAQLNSLPLMKVRELLRTKLMLPYQSHSLSCFPYIPSKPHTIDISILIFYLFFHPCSSLSPICLLGYALDRLVTVSSMCYHTSTSVLSTSSSSRGLTTYVGISHLEGGFTLRCLQRLSRPGLATLPCSW